KQCTSFDDRSGRSRVPERCSLRLLWRSDVEVCVLRDLEHFECAAESQVDGQAQREIEDLVVREVIAQPAEELVVDRTMIDGELLCVLDGQALSIGVRGKGSPLVEMLVHLFGDTGLDD